MPWYEQPGTTVQTNSWGVMLSQRPPTTQPNIHRKPKRRPAKPYVYDVYPATSDFGGMTETLRPFYNDSRQPARRLVFTICLLGMMYQA